MPTAFHIIFGLIAILLVIGMIGTARRLRARHDHGKELGKAKPGERRDL